MSLRDPNRRGGVRLWTDDEMRTLEGAYEDLRTRLPGRGPQAIAVKFHKLVRERAETGAEETP